MSRQATSPRTHRPENPFEQLKPWTLITWLLTGAVPVLLLTALTSIATDGHSIRMTVAGVSLYLLIVGWIAANHVSLRRLVGSLDLRRGTFGATAAGLAAMVASAGIAGLGLGLLNLVAPRLAESVMDVVQSPTRAPRSTSSTLEAVSNVLVVLDTSLLSPAVEELLFRGVLLHAWARRWGLKASILISSALFASLHVYDPLGSFLVGIVMSLIYLRTRSLLVPIAVHVFNNGIACLMTICFPNVVDRLPELRREGWLFATFLLVATPILVWFFRRTRDCWTTSLPYLDPPAIEPAAATSRA